MKKTDPHLFSMTFMFSGQRVPEEVYYSRPVLERVYTSFGDDSEPEEDTLNVYRGKEGCGPLGTASGNPAPSFEL